MNVREMIEWLGRFPPDAPVLRATPDSLVPAMPPEKATALLDGDGDWWFDAGENETPEATYGKRCDVVVLG